MTDLVAGAVELPSHGGASVGFRSELGSFAITAAADTEVEYDLRDRFPGRVEVTVRLDGRPASGLVLLTSAADQLGGATAALTDRAGRTALSLPVGVCSLSARSPHQAWSTT